MLWVGTTEQLTSHLYDQRDYSCKTFLVFVIIRAHGRCLAELWILSVLICKISIVNSVVWFKSSSWSDVLILWDCCVWKSLSFGGELQISVYIKCWICWKVEPIHFWFVTGWFFFSWELSWQLNTIFSFIWMSQLYFENLCCYLMKNASKITS